MKILQTNKKLKAALEEVESDNAALHKEIAELQDAKATIAEKEESLATLTVQVTALTEEKDELSNTLEQVRTDLEAKNETLTNELAEQKAATEAAENSAKAKALDIAAAAGHKEKLDIEEDDTAKEATREEFRNMTPSARQSFLVSGGKLK